MEECPMTFTNTYITKFAGAFFARSKVLLAAAGILLLSLLVACASTDDDNGGGGSADTYTVGGTVAGHTGKVSLTLTYGDDDKTDTLEVEAGTDKFTFAAKLEDSQSFTLAVTAPVGQACRSSITQGTIVNANITNVEITCKVASYSVGGTVSGLADGDTITLTLTPTGGSAETEDVTGNGNFSFDTVIAYGTTYTVTTTSPADKACEVAPRGTLTMGDADADITVTCVPTYSVSGTVASASTNSELTIILLHADPATPNPVNIATIDVTPNTADGTFTINGVPENKIYFISVTSDTTNEICAPTSKTFSAPVTADVTGVQITCSIVTTGYSVKGKISGLVTGEILSLTLTLANSVVENKVVIGDKFNDIDDTFAFDTKLANGDIYAVTVTTAPAGKTCTVGNAGTGTIGNADVTDLSITCVVKKSVRGSVSGLASGETITLTLTPTGGTAENKIITGDADATTADNYAFDTRVAIDSTYIVTTTSPAGKVCTVAPTGTQTMGDADANIMVICVIGYSVGGNISGLEEGEVITLTLTPTGGTTENKIITGDADATTADNYAFDTRLAIDSTYVVTTTSPSGKDCTVDNGGTLTMGRADVTDISVTCVVAYSISGRLTGSASTGINIYVILTLYDDNTGTGATGLSLPVLADGTFSFTGIKESKFYTLKAVSRTFGETCSGGSITPTMITGDITDVQVTCTASTHTGPFIKIELLSTSDISLVTVNVFTGDGAIPDTSDPTTATQVIRGSDTDVIIIPNINNTASDAFISHISIEANKYYAITETSTCTITSGASGGPVTDNVSISITC